MSPPAEAQAALSTDSSVFHQVQIPSTQNAVAALLDAMVNEMQQCNYPERIVFQVRLAVGEALTNAAKHAHGYDPDKLIDVRYKMIPEEIEVDILDQGPGFNPDDILDQGPGFNPDDLLDPVAPENIERPCGRGVFLIRQYMSMVIYHPPGNRVTMKKSVEIAGRE